MIFSTRTTFLLIAAIAIATAAGCRDFELSDSWTPDASTFDANVEDDSGPGALCPPGTPDLFNNYYSPYFGGDVSVDLEVSNCSYFRCPHCASFSRLSAKLLQERKDIRDRVRIYYHHYPFNYESAWALHGAAVAAGNQGMENFWAVHDYIYAGMLSDPPEYYSAEDVVEFADDVLYLDIDQLVEDMNSDVTYAFLQWDKNQALAQEVYGTPSVFICGEKISWGSLEDKIDSYLYPEE